jgi:hypothetical protein
MLLNQDFISEGFYFYIKKKSFFKWWFNGAADSLVVRVLSQ